MRISDWSSDVCSSDLASAIVRLRGAKNAIGTVRDEGRGDGCEIGGRAGNKGRGGCRKSGRDTVGGKERKGVQRRRILRPVADVAVVILLRFQLDLLILRSEEHKSELQSLMRISYAV